MKSIWNIFSQTRAKITELIISWPNVFEIVFSSQGFEREKSVISNNSYAFTFESPCKLIWIIKSLAAWPGFAGPPARGMLVVLVQDISKLALVIGLHVQSGPGTRSIKNCAFMNFTGDYLVKKWQNLNCPHATFICI